MEQSGQSLSLVENATGVGHYKGVMLCNRPFANSVPTNYKNFGPSTPTFTCGVVPESIGLNVPIPTKEKTMKRPKKDSVLVKHKKWLVELQRTKERLEVEYIEEMQKKEDEKLRFQEHEKKMRELSRSILSETKADSKEDGPESNGIASIAESKATSTAGPSLRPAWSMNEEKALQQLQSKQQQEEDDLLQFASSLEDYSSYIQDVELSTTLAKLKKRIAELAKEVATEEARQDEKDSKNDTMTKAQQMAARKEMLFLMHQAASSLEGTQPNHLSLQQDENLLAAKVLLDGGGGDDKDGDLQAVHSTKSVVSLLKAAKEKISQVKEQVRINHDHSPAEPKVTNEPRIVVHEPSEGLRLENKQSIANLPYMHRNPSV